MNERGALMRKLSSAAFAAWELRIFLDTHPNNREAFSMYQKHLAEAARLKTEYEEKFGPISMPDSFDGGSWDWNNSPWPWETETEEV